LLTSEDVKCWGDGADGRLGLLNTESIGDNETPATVGTVDLGVGVKAKQVVAGGTHTCALRTSGNVMCWGLGTDGQLGYGATASIGNIESPASAGTVYLGDGVEVEEIAAGFSHSCALLTTGDIMCWGSGTFGKLGYSNVDAIGDTEHPASAGTVNIGAGVTAKQVATSSSGDSTCALLTTDDVMCWGRNNYGQLGYGNQDDIGDDEHPASAGTVNLGAGAAVKQIAVGGFHTCAVLTTGDVKCWGLNNHGQLGYGNTDDIGDNETPDSVGMVNLGGTAEYVAAGQFHTCALLTTGDVMCWGNSGYGQLGYGNKDSVGRLQVPSNVGPVDL
jgi:alpha-tubulin suppressor-like RCC1 family protein